MPHREPGFLKIGAAHFSLSKTPSSLCCRAENLVTLVCGQCSAQRWLWQEKYLPGARAAQQLQQEADSREQQGALSHCVAAPRDTAAFPEPGTENIPASTEPCRQSERWLSLAAGAGTATQLREGNTCSEHSSVQQERSTPECFNTLQCQLALLGKEISHTGEIKS